jgi:excisionase family DNA binding protein
MVSAAKRFYSTGEAARILGISRVAVFKKIVAGVIPAQKVGGRYLIAATDLGLGSARLKAKDKRRIKAAVKRVCDEYGDVIKMLGNE